MGNSSETKTGAEPCAVRLIASDKAWIEGKAIEQLHAAARLAGMELAVGFPDLHPGKGIPVGAAFVSRGLFHPTLAGNDIGCAMSLWATGLPRRKLKLERWAKRITGLDRPWDGDMAGWCARYDLPESGHNASLGTIGGGNHFAELQVVADVRDRTAFDRLGLVADEALLLIHSGSRSLGEAIYRELLARHGANPLHEGTADAERYLASHDHACRFARASRGLIAHRFGEQIGADVRLVSDVMHNAVAREDWRGVPAWIHRKGAASSREGALVIPGSRGTLSYLVMPTGDGEAAAWSLAHGAGRRWQRGYAKPRLSHKYRVDDLERTDLGGYVICEDRELIYEEAPQAYKDIGGVIADLEAASLISVIAELKPVLTYKVRRGDDD
jgi:release factor H-coupled RctB family protein